MSVRLLLFVKSTLTIMGYRLRLSQFGNIFGGSMAFFLGLRVRVRVRVPKVP